MRVGRYSESAELFRLAYAVLNRMHRAVIAAQDLGDFPEARQLLEAPSPTPQPPYTM